MPTAPDIAASADPVESAPPPPTPGSAAGRNTYGQILKSSVLIGGSTAFTLVFGIFRSKAMALMLGPAGFGLMGLYNSIAQVAQSIAGMGVNASGVREIAAAVGTGENDRIARTAAVLRRTSIALGLSGGALLVAFSGPVAKLTFGSYERTLPVALLSLAVFFAIVSGGQGALLQGMRRIGDLAKMGVLGGLCGTVLTVALVFALRERGLVPALIATAAASLAFSWWYSRKMGIESPRISVLGVGREAGALLKLGFAFMASGMLMTGAAYLVRIIIVRQVGLGAAGLYSSAWTIGGLYVGFILDAMAADFYPRLTASIRNRAECNRIVNEQAHVSLLLAGPGVIATLVLAPLVLTVLYSSAFRDAVPILRWICLGATLKVITWPMGFIIVAEGRQRIFFWVEAAYAAVYLAISWLLVRYLGLSGAGIAFFGSYVFHGALLYPIVRSLTGFRWSEANVRSGLAFLVAIGLVFSGFYVFPFWLATAIGMLLLALNTIYSARALVRLVAPERVPRPIRRLLVLARITPSRLD